MYTLSDFDPLDPCMLRTVRESVSLRLSGSRSRPGYPVRIVQSGGKARARLRHGYGYGQGAICFVSLRQGTFVQQSGPIDSQIAQECQVRQPLCKDKEIAQVDQAPVIKEADTFCPLASPARLEGK